MSLIAEVLTEVLRATTFRLIFQIWFLCLVAWSSMFLLKEFKVDVISKQGSTPLIGKRKIWLHLSLANNHIHLSQLFSCWKSCRLIQNIPNPITHQSSEDCQIPWVRMFNFCLIPNSSSVIECSSKTLICHVWLPIDLPITQLIFNPLKFFFEMHDYSLSKSKGPTDLIYDS